MSIESVMPSNHLILCHPLLLLPSIFSNIRVFFSESALGLRWPEYWSFSFSISPFNEYSGLISFRFDWFDLLSVQGTLKSLLQHHSLKALILCCSAFFMVQLSHLQMTTWKTIVLTIQTNIVSLLSLEVVPNYLYISDTWEDCFLSDLTNIEYFFLFVCFHSWTWYCNCSFFFRLPNSEWSWTSLHVFKSLSVSFSVNCFGRILCPFFFLLLF